MAKNYAAILQTLNDGYTLSQLPEQGISTTEINTFIDYLKQNNLTVEEAMCLNIYSENSTMICAYDRGTFDREQFIQSESADTINKLQQRGISTEKAEQIANIVQQMSQFEPAYENYAKIKDIVQKEGLPAGCVPSLCMFYKRCHTIDNIESIHQSIQSAMAKAHLPASTQVYRAIKADAANIDAVTQSKGIMSTALTLEASFAKYEGYNVVLEFNLPPNAKALDISAFSDYDETEKEVLLYTNDDDKIFVNGVESHGDKTVVSATISSSRVLVTERATNQIEQEKKHPLRDFIQHLQGTRQASSQEKNQKDDDLEL